MAEEGREKGELPQGFIVAERYQIDYCLGSGGMGSVYLAKDLVLNGEPVAIKILHSDLIANQRQTQRFLREVQLMRRVNHSNVVRTFDVGSDGNIVYFTMEFISGKPLESFIEQGSFPRQQLASLIINICEGLDAIHRATIIHRDLKPANILVLKDGNIKITDFGVARPEYSELTAHNEILGSALYIAPEIWLGTKMTPAVDLYSLGVLLYELVTGVLPFDGDSPAALMRMHLEYEPAAPKELESDTPPWLNKLILKLLAKSPVDRPQDAREVVEYVKLHTESGERLTREVTPVPQEKAPADSFLGEMERMTKRSMTSLPTMDAKVRQTQTAEQESEEEEKPVKHPSFRKKETLPGVSEPERVSIGPEILARLLSLLIILLVTLGGGTLLHLIARSASPGELLSLPVNSPLAAVPEEFFGSSLSIVAALFLGWVGVVLKMSALPALLGAAGGSLRTALSILLKSLPFGIVSSALLLLCHLWSGIAGSSASLNVVSLLSGAQAATKNIEEVMMLDPVVSTFSASNAPAGFLSLLDSRVLVWQSAVMAILSLLYLACLAVFAREALLRTKLNPAVGPVIVVGSFVVVAVLAPFLAGEAQFAKTAYTGGLSALIPTVNFPEPVVAYWFCTYLFMAAVSILGAAGARRS